MSRADINLLSFNGPGQNHQTVVISDEVVRPEPGMSDTVKLTSRLTDFSVIFHGEVYGGTEDCVDVNNHSTGLHLSAKCWIPQGKYLATIKGGSSGVTLSGSVRGHGSEVDIDIGNISDQSDNPTGLVYLNLQHEAGDPITVRIVNGVRPVFVNEDVQKYKIVLRVPTFWGSLFAKIVHQLRKIGLA